DAQVTGHLVRNLSEGLLEVRTKLAVSVPQHQVFEWIERRFANPGDVNIVRKHERQFPLEHQCAGRYRGHDIPAAVDPRRKYRDVCLLQIGRASCRESCRSGWVPKQDKEVIKMRHQSWL